MPWLVSRQELTEDQLRAVEMDTREHRIIMGGPGSGKTQILPHRAQHLMYELSVSADQFHIFVFTKTLKDYIKSDLNLLDIPESSVSTLDGWMSDMYRRHIGSRLPWNNKEKHPDFDEIRRAVGNWVLENQSQMPLYEFVLVDEGQDLTSEDYQLLTCIANHVTVCMDHKQQIYDRGSREEDVLKQLDLRRTNINLLETYRCCPYIIELGAAFIHNPLERDVFVHQTRTEQKERETPLLYCADGFEDEKRRLIDIMNARLARNEKVAILFPTNRLVYGFAKGLQELGITVETPRETKYSDELDFGSSNPKLLTYYGVKGLTFDTILMPRLTLSSFSRMDAQLIDRLLFVGITRATNWVYMSLDTSNAKSLDALGVNRIKELQEHGTLSVQKSDLPFFPPSQPDEDTPDDLDDDILDIL